MGEVFPPLPGNYRNHQHLPAWRRFKADDGAYICEPVERHSRLRGRDMDAQARRQKVDSSEYADHVMGFVNFFLLSHNLQYLNLSCVHAARVICAGPFLEEPQVSGFVISAFSVV